MATADKKKLATTRSNNHRQHQHQQLVEDHHSHGAHPGHGAGGCFCCTDPDRNFRKNIVGSGTSSSSSTTTIMTREDSILHAQELNELSPQERERVLEEIHGVAKVHPMEETNNNDNNASSSSSSSPILLLTLTECLEQFKHAVATKIQTSKRRALDRAVFYKPSILTDTKFHLLFLRADQYHPEKAAKRMAQYFQDKLTLFGEERLVKKITLQDLNELGDRKVFDTGFFMVLPHKDQTGRPIWFCDITKFDFNQGASLLRCCWYQVMTTVLEDEDAQLKGICDVAYCPSGISSNNNNNKSSSYLSNFAHVMQYGGNMLMNLPHRITGYHFCYNDPKLQYILTMACRAFGKPIRLRLRTHYGSNLEIQYSLMTFGIECESLLRTDYTTNNDENDNNNNDGARIGGSKNNDKTSSNEATKMHQRYIERRIQIEANEEDDVAKVTTTTTTNGNKVLLLYPKANDVLVGRGRPYREFSGNLRWGNLIDALLEKHYQCSDDRFAKTCISMDVVKTVKERGGRFLSRVEGGWEILDDLKAREKTASGFRSRQLVANKTAATTGGATLESHSNSSRVKRVRYDSGFGDMRN